MVIPEKVIRVGGVNQVPDGVSFAEASVAEPLACVLNGQELARVGAEDAVVVVGAGPIGCLHVRLARARGAARVILVELNRSRLEMSADRVRPDNAVCAADVDAAAEVMRLTGGRGADVVIVAAASGEAQKQALAMVARRGRVSFFGGLPKDNSLIECDSNLVHYRELTIVGANGSSPDHNRCAIDLIASGAVPVADLITHTMPLEQVLEAIQIVTKGEAIKVTIEPGGLSR
jgi:L-iditol 2-dehydrogenase